MKVGILGAGQLSLLMAQANTDSNIHIFPFGDETCSNLANYAHPVYVKGLNDREALKAFIDSVDVLTYETENVPAELLSSLACDHKIAPSIPAVKIFQNRFHEKSYFVSQDIQTTPHMPVVKTEDLAAAPNHVKFPAILKTNSEGYDGKGQVVVKSEADLAIAWDTLNNQDSLLEQMIHFEQEISIVAARDHANHIVYYPVSENFHQDGQLILSLVTDPHPLQQMAEEVVKKILTDLDYVGCIAVEFFVKDDALLVNEVAPRVHNSGHWTTDGANISQFANHLQAVSGKDVVQPTLKGPVAMVNCIGNIPTVEASTQVPCCTLYDYKKSPKPKRKLGHMNILGNAADRPTFYRNVASALELIGERILAERVLSRV